MTTNIHASTSRMTSYASFLSTILFLSGVRDPSGLRAASREWSVARAGDGSAVWFVGCIGKVGVFVALVTPKSSVAPSGVWRIAWPAKAILDGMVDTGFRTGQGGTV